MESIVDWLMINEKNSSEENYFPARLAQTQAIEILNYIFAKVTERHMPPRTGESYPERRSTERILEHPMIWDTRTVRECLEDLEADRHAAVTYAPPLTCANSLESACPELSS